MKKYKLIIAGSRSINKMDILEKAIAYFKINPEEIKEVVSGCAYGIDTLGKWWAEKNNIKVKEFPAKWDDLETPPLFIKENNRGKYNALAGIVRNRQMGDYADRLLCIWNGESKGSENMINYMKELKKEVMVYEI
jgi:hypothetical protein